MCIESSPLDVNSTTIYMGMAIPEYELYSWSREAEQYTCSIHHTSAKGPTLEDLCHRRKVRLRPFLEIARCILIGTSMNCFSHENQPCPPSLSVRGKLKLGTKSDIVRCLEDAPEVQDDTSVDGVVLDGLAILYVLKPAAARTFANHMSMICSYHNYV